MIKLIFAIFCLLFLGAQVRAANYNDEPQVFISENCKASVTFDTILIEKEGESRRYSGSTGRSGDSLHRIKMGDSAASSKYIDLVLNDDGTYRVERTHDGISPYFTTFWDKVVCESLVKQ